MACVMFHSVFHHPQHPSQAASDDKTIKPVNLASFFIRWTCKPLRHSSSCSTQFSRTSKRHNGTSRYWLDASFLWATSAYGTFGM